MTCSIQSLVCLVTILPGAVGAEPTAAERGRQALLERSYNPVIWSTSAYENAWRHWQSGSSGKPESYPEALRARYGLHVAPYPNGDYPMGIRPARGILGTGLTTDCMLCHGGAVAGQSYVGLGNSTLDMQTLYEELAKADGGFWKPPFVFSNVRGTTEAGAMAVYLLERREPDLSMRKKPLELGLRDDLCEDPPAWWLLKKKKTMYWTGSTDARSVRSLMQFMMSPLNTAAAIKREEQSFRDIQAYLLSLAAPRYPRPIDDVLAAKGLAVFQANCVRCHGTYGPDGSYPNKIVPIEEIATDRTRLDGFADRAGAYYNETWFAHEKPASAAESYAVRATKGYQAPPLDGVWATAPYFHNGSAPTIYHVLNSKARPERFTRSFSTDAAAYDWVKVGWLVQTVNGSARLPESAIERRKIYDTTQPGRGNGGHLFGDHLMEDERLAVIEYLKTL
jgi:mono/diheme cytochrome c family protein